MKLKDLHKTCIELGIRYDVRPKERIDMQLKRHRDEAKGKTGVEKKLVDEERFWNPYHDSRIIHGTGEEKVQRLFVGIDVDVPQLHTVERLRERGERIDAVMLHHPQGRASVELSEDMLLQIDLYRKYGVPVVKVEQQLQKTIEETRLTSHAENVFEWERTAEILGIPGFCCHTPADNLIYQYLEKGLCRGQYRNVGELWNAILEIPEFLSYAERGLRPELVNCTEQSRTGRIAPTGINGGTEGPPSFIAEQAEAGIGTILMMHADKEQLQKAKDHHINIIQLNHYAGDELGMNLMLDLLLRKDPKLEFFPGCGFERHEHKKDLKILTSRPRDPPPDGEVNS